MTILYFGPVQGTGGSTSIANSLDAVAPGRSPPPAPCWSPAAAAEWGVPEGQITVRKGVLTSPSLRPIRDIRGARRRSGGPTHSDRGPD
jgi:isoquinoline 1-oxidoreductase beta subunit